MDDPISALDANLRKEVMEQVILGQFSQLTRMLVTHSLEYLPQADRICILKNGRVHAFNTFASLQANPYFQSVLQTFNEKAGHSGAQAQPRTPPSQTPSKFTPTPVQTHANLIKKQDELQIAIKPQSWLHFYHLSGGIRRLCPFLLIFVCFYLAQTTRDYLIQQFADLKPREQQAGFAAYFSQVAGLTVGLTVLLLAQAHFKAELQIGCSSSLFQMMLDRLLKAPINLYYDQTPTSRIMSLFLFEL